MKNHQNLAYFEYQGSGVKVDRHYFGDPAIFWPACLEWS